MNFIRWLFVMVIGALLWWGWADPTVGLMPGCLIISGIVLFVWLYLEFLHKYLEFLYKHVFLRYLKPRREVRDSSVAEKVRACRHDAENGVVEAQVVLADAYYEGIGVPQNLAEAIHWYRKAAEQGDVLAQYNLGDAYATGKGIPQDFVEAARWFRKAAEQGDEDARYNLNLMRKRGQL